MRVLVSAGEPSGDAHAADVLRALRRARPDVVAEGVGGGAMQAAGARLLERADRLSAMGVVEAVGTLPRHVQLLRELRHRLRRGHYELALLVDYPGFHLALAAAAAGAGVPVLYYIAPQLWAWGAWRVRALQRSVRQLAVILPFEEAFFRDRGIRSTFVGHPLLDRPLGPDRETARRALGVPPAAPLLAVFPGSRPAELRRLWPCLREAATSVRRAVPELEVVVATSAPLETERHRMRRWPADPAYVLAGADAALCKSGTVTLEAALADLPMVIAYRVHPLTYRVAAGLVRVGCIGLVNLIAGRVVVPELLQDRARPDILAESVRVLLDRDGPAARQQREAFAEVRQRLGSPGAARRVAALALELAG